MKKIMILLLLVFLCGCSTEYGSSSSNAIELLEKNGNITFDIDTSFIEENHVNYLNNDSDSNEKYKIVIKNEGVYADKARTGFFNKLPSEFTYKQYRELKNQLENKFKDEEMYSMESDYVISNVKKPGVYKIEIICDGKVLYTSSIDIIQIADGELGKYSIDRLAKLKKDKVLDKKIKDDFNTMILDNKVDSFIDSSNPDYNWLIHYLFDIKSDSLNMEHIADVFYNLSDYNSKKSEVMDKYKVGFTGDKSNDYFDKLLEISNNSLKSYEKLRLFLLEHNSHLQIKEYKKINSYAQAEMYFENISSIIYDFVQNKELYNSKEYHNLIGTAYDLEVLSEIVLNSDNKVTYEDTKISNYKVLNNKDIELVLSNNKKVIIKYDSINKYYFIEDKVESDQFKLLLEKIKKNDKIDGDLYTIRFFKGEVLEIYEFDGY